MRLIKLLLVTALVMDAALVMASPNASSPPQTAGSNGISGNGSFSVAIAAIATPE